MRYLILLFLFGVAFLGGCAGEQHVPAKNVITHEVSISHLISDGHNPGCLQMFNNYCTQLYSPEAMGNLVLTSHNRTLRVLQGQTTNDFSLIFFEFAKAKLAAITRLPEDFKVSLIRQQYFIKLREFINRSPRENMTIQTSIQLARLESDLETVWSNALQETMLRRMDKKYPGFHKIKELQVPLELSLEQSRMLDKLKSEIAVAVWAKHPKWHDVENRFAELKDTYVKVISRMKIPDELKARWLTRIQRVRLVIPGSHPELNAPDCASTTVNAFYQRYENIMTVCAGDFNSEDILQTLAHELGHALDFETSLADFNLNSGLGQAITKVRADLCSRNSFDCQEWSSFKERYQERLEKLTHFEAEVPQLQRCLKRHPSDKIPVEADYQRWADSHVAEQLTSIAENGFFLRLIKAKMPTIAGHFNENPYYMNPCNYYVNHESNMPLDDELTALTFYTAEFRCSQGEDKDRMKTSVEKAKTMMVEIVAQLMKNEGEFSARERMELEGFSSSPIERFADVLGSYVFAEYLRHLPDLSERRGLFLASNAWQCQRPSLSRDFPEEDAVQKSYLKDPHTDGFTRKQEVLSQPVRTVLSCEKDFEAKECTLDIEPPQIQPNQAQPNQAQPNPNRSLPSTTKTASDEASQPNTGAASCFGETCGFR